MNRIVSKHSQMTAVAVALLFFCCATQLTAQVAPDVAATFQQASDAMRRGDLNAAADGFTTVVKRAPRFAEAHFNLGLVREEQGRLDDAVANFQRALALKPRLRGGNLFLAVAHYKLNHLDDALAAVKKETAAYPSDPSAWMWLGVIELAKEQPEQAASALDKASQLAPDNVDILYHRGRAHLLVSKSSYERMFKVDPKSWRVLQVLAQANSEADRHTDAVAEYEAAIRLSPTQPGLHEELGSEFHSLGKLHEAEEAYIRELQIDPHNALARYKLGILSLEQGEAAKGKELMEAALLEKPGLPDSDYNLGRADMLLGDDVAAASRLERATSAPASDPEVNEQAWYQLGIVYRRLHRTEDAKRAMATFQKLKEAEAENSQKALKRYEEQQPIKPEQPVGPENPR